MNHEIEPADRHPRSVPVRIPAHPCVPDRQSRVPTRRPGILAIAAITSTFALAACGDDSSSDGGVDAMSDVDSSTPLSAISGTVIQRHITINGEELAPYDLAADFPIEVMSADADGAFTSYAGQGTAEGAFEFPDVPMDMTYLRFGGQYFHTVQRTFDLGTYTSERANAEQTTQATMLDLQFDGLAPWAAGHQLQMHASGVDLWLPLPADNAPMNDGETALTTSMDYHAVGQGPYLIAGSQGDDVWFSQLAATPIPGTGASYLSVIKALNAPAFDLQDGQTTSITGTFQDVPQDLSFDVDWRGSTFAALSPTLLPDGATVDMESSYLVASASHNPVSDGAKSASADLFQMNFETVTEDIQFTATIGNPFPERWGHLGLIVWSVATTVDDGAGGTVNLTAAYLRQDALGDLFGGPIQPQASPVQDLRVQGLDASTAQNGLPESPEVTWSAPAQGEVAFYEVRVNRLEAGGNVLLTRLHTYGTAVYIPPGLMEVGERYAFEVRAHVMTDDPMAGPFGLVLGRSAIGRTTHIMAR